MFIKRVSLKNFGRLTGDIHFDPDKCNIICQDNEYGKTTVMDAVLYTLYNFPTTGFSRDTLKPRDRYRPWNGSGNSQNDFLVELELRDVGDRNYVLRADFGRQQPFTLHDADTRQPIALDGMTFGQRYLRMPLSSFTQCFFLRQDEKGSSGKAQLVSVIEEAAASNRKETPGNVSEAIERLSSPRMSESKVAPEPLLLKNLVKRLEERRDELKSRQRTLEQDLEKHKHEIEASEDLDGEIDSLNRQIVHWRYQLLLARRQEKQTVLNRYNEGRDAVAERTRLLEELEPFGEFEPGRRTGIMALLGDWKLARQLSEEAGNALESKTGTELKALEADLSAYPETAAELQSDDLENLRSFKTVLRDRESQLARQSELLAQLEATLTAQGVPLERLSDLHEADSHLSVADREVLFEHEEARNEAQSALTAIEQASLGAREQALQAKTRRSYYGNMGTGMLVVVIGLMVTGIVLLITGIGFFGWVCLIAAVAIGVAAAAFVGAMRSKVSEQELNPAIQSEMELAGQARLIREQLDTIEKEYQTTLEKLRIGPEQVQELREINHWQQSASPWIAARDAVKRLNEEIDSTRAAATGIIEIVEKQEQDRLVDEEYISETIGGIERYFTLKKELTSARENTDRLSAESERLQSDFQTKNDALEKLVQCPQTDEFADMEEKAGAYLTGCEKALQLQTLRQEYGSLQGMTDEEAAALQSDLDGFTKDVDSLIQDNPDLEEEKLSEGMRADDLERRVSQAHHDRDELKERRNRGFRDAENAVNEWRTKGPEIEAELSQVVQSLDKAVEFGMACELAHSELSDIAAQVYTQWATALNERVNRIVPLLNDRYKDVALSPELDVSVYSAEAGRRLETREVQHLSKGARDQLLLSMRIAIAEYLSAHVGSLPLVLDEPFAHWDDQRFVEGMRFLTRLSDSHQVILLSCHGWRYAHLRESAPEVLEAVNFCELTV